MLTHAELTEKWIREGFRWFDIDEPKPEGWNAYNQLYAANLGWALPQPQFKVQAAA
jgi:hypothetical protein